MTGPMAGPDPGPPPSHVGKGQPDPWEPAEFINEMNETRWQPVCEDTRLYETAAGLRWLERPDGVRDPKLYRNRLRAYRIGKRRFRKSASATWTEMATGGRVVRAGPQEIGWDGYQHAEGVVSGWRQSDHGEEVHE